MKTDSAYMENQRSIPLHPALARTFGDRAAIFLQQLRYWMETYSASEGKQPVEKRKHYRDGRWWAYNTYEQWQRDNFSFWSVSTIGRIVRELEARDVLLSEAFHEKDGDRTKWYSIDFDRLDELVAEQEARYQAEQKAEIDPSCQIDTTMMSECNDHDVKMAQSINIDTESTTESTTEKEQKITDAPMAVGAEPSGEDSTNAEPRSVQEPKADQPHTEADDKQPHIAIIEDGYLATLAELGRPVVGSKRDPIKSRVAVASAMVKAEPVALTWRDVRAFLRWYYSDKNDQDTYWKNKLKPIPLENVAEMLPTWIAQHKPKPAQYLFVPVPEWRRRLEANPVCRTVDHE